MRQETLFGKQQIDPPAQLSPSIFFLLPNSSFSSLNIFPKLPVYQFYFNSSAQIDKSFSLKLPVLTPPNRPPESSCLAIVNGGGKRPYLALGCSQGRRRESGDYLRKQCSIFYDNTNSKLESCNSVEKDCLTVFPKD